MSANSSASTTSRMRRKRRHGERGPRSRCSGGSTLTGLVPTARTSVRGSRRRSSRAALLQAEDRAQDDLERQRLQARVQRHRLAARPALDLRRPRPRPSPRASRATCSPWKAGSMSRRWARWASSSSRITELRPISGSRMRAPLPGCRTSARRREDLLDVVGVGEHDERRRGEQADREAPAEARPAALEERAPAASTSAWSAASAVRSVRAGSGRGGGHRAGATAHDPWHSCYRSANACLPHLARCPTVGAAVGTLPYRVPTRGTTQPLSVWRSMT